MTGARVLDTLAVSCSAVDLHARTDTRSPACQPHGERDTPGMKAQEVQRWRQVAHRRDVCMTCRRHHENGGGLLLARAQVKEAGLAVLLDGAGYALMMHTFPPQRGQKVWLSPTIALPDHGEWLACTH